MLGTCFFVVISLHPKCLPCEVKIGKTGIYFEQLWRWINVKRKWVMVKLRASYVSEFRMRLEVNISFEKNEGWMLKYDWGFEIEQNPPWRNLMNIVAETNIWAMWLHQEFLLILKTYFPYHNFWHFSANIYLLRCNRLSNHIWLLYVDLLGIRDQAREQRK